VIFANFFPPLPSLTIRAFIFEPYISELKNCTA
jgi:hypothetical protein